MNIFIILTILALNAIAIVILYQFVKTLEKREKILFIAVTVAVNYMIVSALYFFSSIGMDKVISQNVKSFVEYMFVPVNIILIMPFLASTYIKAKAKKISRDKLKKRFIIIAICILVILVVEFFYFKNIQLNISKLNILK